MAGGGALSCKLSFTRQHVALLGSGDLTSLLNAANIQKAAPARAWFSAKSHCKKLCRSSMALCEDRRAVMPEEPEKARSGCGKGQAEVDSLNTCNYMRTGAMATAHQRRDNISSQTCSMGEMHRSCIQWTQHGNER